MIRDRDSSLGCAYSLRDVQWLVPGSPAAFHVGVRRAALKGKAGLGELSGEAVLDRVGGLLQRIRQRFELVGQQAVLPFEFAIGGYPEGQGLRRLLVARGEFRGQPVAILAQAIALCLRLFEFFFQRCERAGTGCIGTRSGVLLHLVGKDKRREQQVLGIVLSQRQAEHLELVVDDLAQFADARLLPFRASDAVTSAADLEIELFHASSRPMRSSSRVRLSATARFIAA